MRGKLAGVRVQKGRYRDYTHGPSCPLSRILSLPRKSREIYIKLILQ